MLIGKIHHFYQNVSDALGVSREFLADGTYRVTPSFDVIYREGMEKEAAEESRFLYKNLSSNPSGGAKLFARTMSWKIDKCGKAFSGTILIPGTNGKDIKVLDPAAGEVATLFRDAERGRKLLENREFWGKYFRVVRAEILAGDGEDLPGGVFVIREKMIRKMPFDPEQGLYQVMEGYRNYLSHGDRSRDSGGEAAMRQGTCPCDSLPCCMAHGDLWSSNLLYDGTDYYYIDFEHVAPRYFLSDVLYYIFAEAFVKGDDKMMKSYLSGKYDAELSELFSAAGISFEPEEKTCYFKIFLDELYRERWEGRAKEETIARYKKFVETYLA